MDGALETKTGARLDDAVAAHALLRRRAALLEGMAADTASCVTTEGVRVAVCGPPEMWEDMKAALLELGHAEQNLVELKALTDDQVRWGPRGSLEGSLCPPKR